MIDHYEYANSTEPVVLSAGRQCLRDGADRFVEQFLSLFYLISPSATTYDHSYQVPDYEVAVSFEIIYLKLQSN